MSAPDKIGRYDYGGGNIRYTEGGMTIGGQTEYIRADLVPRVKDLEFFDNNNETWQAMTLVGEYGIALEGQYRVHAPPIGSIGLYPNLEAAKAAAQAHYNALILGALDMVDDDAQAIIERALNIVEASGQFNITRMQPPIGSCRTCWGSKLAPSGVGGGSYVSCPHCATDTEGA